MRIAISEIKVNPGRRETNPKDVRELADSIQELGMLHPIIVNKKHTLIAGLHRLEAAKLLGWTEIECTVSSLKGLKAEMAEIDENVVRNELSTVELGELLLKRKEIYEVLHPEVRHGGDRKSKKIKTKRFRFDSAKSFSQDTAEKIGVTPRTIEHQIQIAKKLTQEAKDILQRADIKIGKQTALKLSRLMPEQQLEAANMLAAGEIRSMEQYNTLKLKQEKNEPVEPKWVSKESVQEVRHTSEQISEESDKSYKEESGVSEEMEVSEQESEIPVEEEKSIVEERNEGGSVLNQCSETMVADSCSHEAVVSFDGPDEAAENVPYRLPDKQFNSFKESVADLKNPNKDCSCTPDIFLAEYTSFVRKFMNEIQWYTLPHYEAVFSTLNQKQIDYLHLQTQILCSAAENLVKQVERMSYK